MADDGREPTRQESIDQIREAIRAVRKAVDCGRLTMWTDDPVLAEQAKRLGLDIVGSELPSLPAVWSPSRDWRGSKK